MTLASQLKIVFCSLLAGTGALALLAFAGELAARQLGPAALIGEDAAPRRLDDLSLPPLPSTAAYEAVAETALDLRPMDLQLAREATLKTLDLDPANVSAWNRLAYIDLAANGRITRNGLAALYKSYEVSPFGNSRVMMWRVDFATQVWPSLPDDLRQMTLAQIPVIGEIHTTWDWRITACRQNPYREIWEPACASAPGIDRPGTS